MRVSEKGRLVYVNPPRTGSTKTNYLMKITWDDVWQPAECAGHHTVWKPEWEGFFVFQTVRSPFTRAVSLWRRCVEALHCRNEAWLGYLNHGRISFKDFLYHEEDEIKAWWEWCRCVQFSSPVPHVDLVVHQENLTAELRGVPGLRSSPNRLMESQLKTPWYKHYDESCIFKVLEIFADDFEAYGYSRDFDRCRKGKLFR